MRFLSLKALFVLVVLPPVLYVAALQGLEGYLEHHYRDVITNRIPGDSQALLAGRVRLTDQLQTVVDDLIADAVFHHRGVVLSVVIRTRAGLRLYPPSYSDDMATDPAPEPMRVASENFALLNEGLDVSLDVAISHNTLAANGLLVTCVLFSLTGLAVVYRRGTRVYLQEKAQRQHQSEAIRAREDEQKVALIALEEQKDDLAARIRTI
jgi:hypothetical protein